MSEGYEYNLLTQELLLQGYTAEHYPDYVRIGNGRLGKSSLENSCGGFIYTKDYLEKKAFMSGCGLYVSWEKCINDIDYLGKHSALKMIMPFFGVHGIRKIVNRIILY